MNPTSSFDAVLFDLDGVLTSTAALHATTWKRTFDPLLALWGQEPFDSERDYLDHVDGKPRADGVRDFLASRGVTLDDPSVLAIAGRKQTHFERALDDCGVEAFPGSIRWVRHLRALGLWTAVVSSSANTDRVPPRPPRRRGPAPPRPPPPPPGRAPPPGPPPPPPAAPWSSRTRWWAWPPAAPAPSAW